jgi:hypothetical protein
MRFAALSLFFMLMMCAGAYAQQDSSAGNTQSPADSVSYRPQHMALLDSVAQATALQQKLAADSVAMVFIMPDSARSDQFTALLLKQNLYTGHTFLDIPFTSKKSLGYGRSRKSRDPFVIIIITCLLLYTAFLNFALSKDIKNIFRSFYSNRTVQLDKEDRGVNVWAFISLFLLFGFTFGLFLYQLLHTIAYIM